MNCCVTGGAKNSKLELFRIITMLVCPECQRILEENFSNQGAMIFVRWKKAFRNRYAGTDCKTPIGAVAKSYGTERMEKGGMKPSVASHEAERK